MCPFMDFDSMPSPPFEFPRFYVTDRGESDPNLHITNGERCNFCGHLFYDDSPQLFIRYYKDEHGNRNAKCDKCGVPIEKETPIAEPGHPFPHNHVITLPQSVIESHGVRLSDGGFIPHASESLKKYLRETTHKEMNKYHHKTIFNNDGTERCNYCGLTLEYQKKGKRKRKCAHCGSRIYDTTPTPEAGHPFPHNHRPLRTCHQDSG